MNQHNYQAALALKRLAATPALAKRFHESADFRALLQPAARRYVVAEDATSAVEGMQLLAGKGYEVGFEFVGENVTDVAEVQQIVQQYQYVIGLLPAGGLSPRTEINFDLSNVGLLIGRDLAIESTRIIANAAREKGLFFTISMERASMVDDILSIFFELADTLPNLGITLQAYLHRTASDLDALVATGCKVRLVKGVYTEDRAHALPRSPELDARYLALAARLDGANVPRSFATHDPDLIARLRQAGLLNGTAEIEMLHGVQPELIRRLHEDGVRCRIYGAYGVNWYLHFMHRLAESPANVVQALADFNDPGRVAFGADY